MTSIQFPSELSKEKQDFVLSFYRVSDEPTSVDKYLAFLTEDVDFVMGLKEIQGAEGVRKMREAMWGGVKTRHHKPEKVYLADPAASELMIHGTVDYGLSNGKTVDSVGWAARVVFAPGEQLKMSRYQVWLDSTPLSNALKEL